MSDPSRVLNVEFLDELQEIMEEEFTALLEIFLAESAKQFEAVRGSWDQGDLEALRRSAHSLKGSCGNVGAESLQSICSDLERNAQEGVSDPIPQLIEQASGELVQVSDEIQRIHLTH